MKINIALQPWLRHLMCVFVYPYISPFPVQVSEFLFFFASYGVVRRCRPELCLCIYCNWALSINCGPNQQRLRPARQLHPDRAFPFLKSFKIPRFVNFKQFANVNRRILEPHILKSLVGIKIQSGVSPHSWRQMHLGASAHPDQTFCSFLEPQFFYEA